LRHYIITLIGQYGNAGIALGLALEFLGLPIPGESMMAFVGYMAEKSAAPSLALPIIYAVVGTNIGSILAYAIGFRYGEKALIKYGRYIFITDEKLKKTENFVNKDRVLLILLSRYIPGIRHVTPYLCGISRINLSSFLIFNFIGSLIWCVSFIALGSFLGEKWKVIEGIVRGYFLIFVLLTLFAIVVVRYFRKHKEVIFMITFPTILFIKLSEDLLRDELTVFDSTIYSYLSRYISKNLTWVMKAVSDLGSAPVLIAIAISGFIILRKSKKYYYSKVIMINLVAVWVLNDTFKVVFHRQRPDILRLVEAGGFSFPSGHSMISMGFYGFLIYLCNVNIEKGWERRIAVFLMSLLILFIGISRIYLGVHYASDVLAGFSAGLAWLVIFITLVNKYYISRFK